MARKHRRQHAAFWERWGDRWGPLPGTVPARLFWTPAVGRWSQVGITEIGSLTPWQLDACHDMTDMALKASTNV